MLCSHPQPGHWVTCLNGLPPHLFSRHLHSPSPLLAERFRLFLGRRGPRRTCRAEGLLIWAGVFSGGSQWGVGSLPWLPSVHAPELPSSGVRRCFRPARRPGTPYTARDTAQLPPFTDRAGACAGRAEPANLRGPRHQRASAPPPLSNGSRRRQAAAAGDPVRLRALRPRPPPPGPRRRAAWSGR